MTLGAQSVDSNSLLGNVDLSYKYSYYDGAVIPIGLGLSLLLNGIFLAHKINREQALTLPDVLASRYGKSVEFLVSLTTITSFLMLLAGNLVGMGVVTAYLWGIEESAGIWLAAGIVWAYTVSGGLFSVAYTDVAQGMMGWSGVIVFAYWFIANAPEAPAPSIGFPAASNETGAYMYLYDDIADLYQGINCTNNPDMRCYNEELWCPANGTSCVTDNAAYPYGDLRVYSTQMSDPYALAPFPNSLFWNWATILILGFGNLGALDFQVRCMASKTPRIARIGCFIGGLFTFFVGIPFSFLGPITRVYYGPDSPHAMFEADTCSAALGLPTCAEWVPDPVAFIKLATNQAPPVIGAWCLIGIVAASMSTADGAILAMGTVASHNLMRMLDVKWPGIVTAKNLLMVARLSTIPFTLASTMIGAYYRSSDSAAGATGYLLIVAFDIVLATVVAPLFGCFYAKNPSPRAAFCSVVCGAIVRILLEFLLPKDGFLLMPYNNIIFYNYGTAASVNLPKFFDVDDALWWDPKVEVCEQEQFKDFTGVDSLSAFLCSILVFTGVQLIENKLGRPLFNFPGLVPYRKDLSEPGDTEKAAEVDKAVEMEETTASKSYTEGVVKGIEDSEDSSSGNDPVPAIDVGIPAGKQDSEHYA
jgi:Na+/proline symporter